MDGLGEIFLMQANLQRKIRGRIGECEIADQTTAQRIEAIKGNVFALEHELHELIDEMKWKDWTAGESFLNRDLAVKEWVDAFHFLINIALHLGVTPDEVLEAYRAKNKVNHQRQDEAYDGVTTKCASCGRALEDVAITEIQTFGGRFTFTCVCGEKIDPAVATQFVD